VIARLGFEGEFCKHLVAAGLASIDPDPESKGKAREETKTGKPVKMIYFAYLERQDKIFWSPCWRAKRSKTQTARPAPP